MDEEVKFALKVVVGMILVLGIIMFSCLGVGVIVEQKTCTDLQTLNETFEFHWLLFGGCRVKTQSGYWMHYSDFNFIELDK